MWGTVKQGLRTSRNSDNVNCKRAACNGNCKWLRLRPDLAPLYGQLGAGGCTFWLPRCAPFSIYWRCHGRKTNAWVCASVCVCMCVCVCWRVVIADCCFTWVAPSRWPAAECKRSRTRTRTRTRTSIESGTGCFYFSCATFFSTVANSLYFYFVLVFFLFCYIAVCCNCC